MNNKKNIMLSIKPKYVELIASGQKTIEVRKNRPKIETPFKCYIYCTIGNGVKGDYLVPSGIQCGKVIGEFVCDRICKLKTRSDDYGRCWHEWNEWWCDESGMQLSYKDIDKYLGKNNGYGWHISDLKIYDKPRELGEFGQKCEDANEIHCRDCLIRKGWNECCEVMLKPLKRPFQSWGYCESLGE